MLEHQLATNADDLQPVHSLVDRDHQSLQRLSICSIAKLAWHHSGYRVLEAAVCLGCPAS